MNKIGAGTVGTLGTFSLDSTVPDAAPRDFEAFRREWEAQFGPGSQPPILNPATTGDFRVKIHGIRLRDVSIIDLYGVSAVRTSETWNCMKTPVHLYVLRRGAGTVGGGPDGGEHTVSTGRFFVRHFETAPRFETAPHTMAKILHLPARTLEPLLRDRTFTGPADSAEMRILFAYTQTIRANMTDLSQPGVQAVNSTLIELAKAVVTCGFDDAEPLLAPALAQAAKNLVDSHLAEAELSLSMLARTLHVSVRTLQRAFATTEESAGAYIRGRRLEEARLALLSTNGRLNISELAARLRFADSSHFIRAFKKRYGQTPTEYARSTSVDSRQPRKIHGDDEPDGG